jgi:uncharacterized membrane protein
MVSFDESHDESIEESESSSRNVSTVERWASVFAGAAMLTAAARKRNALGAVAAVGGLALLYRGASGHCPVYRAMGVSTAENVNPNATIQYEDGVRVERAVTVMRPAAELFRYWRDLTNLPHFMEHLREVRVIDEKRSHWTAEGPMGKTFEWDAEIINEVPNELIGWKSSEGSDVAHAGSVHFREVPGDHGTEVRVVMRYEPPGGRIGRVVAAILGEEPSMQVASDLRRFKRILETGEEPTVEGQPSARA